MKNWEMNRNEKMKNEKEREMRTNEKLEAIRNGKRTNNGKREK